MALMPQLNVVCSRCGKPRGLTHVCFSNSKQKASAKPVLSFGKCGKCKKPVSNPLTHTCRPKSDFKRRRREHEKAEKAAARKKRQQNAHDYQACSDGNCPRTLCVAFKTGYKTGDRDGYDHGFQIGWDRGFPAGQAACPRAHQ